MKLDIKKWNTARLETEAKIRALKKAIRSHHIGGDWMQYRDLKNLKAEATRLYLIRTEARRSVREGYENSPVVYAEFALVETAEAVA